MKTPRPLMLLCLFLAALPASGANVSEYAVKAAYLFNFAKSVEWPKNAFPGDRSPIVVGVLGADPFGKTLDDAVKGKTVEGRPLAVKRFESFDTAPLGDLRNCHILFISDSERDRIKEILSALKGAGLLTVSEIDQFPMMGGMILFDQEGDRIALVVNPRPVKKAGLTLGSELLQLSRIYKKSVDVAKVKALYADGVSLYLNGMIHEAIDKWKQCLEEDPDNVNAQQDLEKARSKLKSIKNLN